MPCCNNDEFHGLCPFPGVNQGGGRRGVPNDECKIYNIGFLASGVAFFVPFIFYWIKINFYFSSEILDDIRFLPLVVSFMSPIGE